MRIILASILLLASATATAAEPIAELKALAPYIGTWTSIQKPDDCEKFVDVQKWEWAFRGQVIRLTHSVNGGEYAGESLIHWDATAKNIIYRYVNTSNFYTDGIITILKDGSLEVRENIFSSNKMGRQSHSGYRIEDGKMHSWSKFLTEGTWGEADHYTYNNTPDAVIMLSD